MDSEWPQRETHFTLSEYPIVYKVFCMGVSKNSGTPKSSILIGFSIINYPFLVPLFLETPTSQVVVGDFETIQV